MKHKFHRFLLFVGLVVLSAFTLLPPVHQIPEGNKFVPEVVYQKPPVATFTLSTSGGEFVRGSEVCVALTAKEFDRILSMQYSLQWDAKVLKFNRLQNFGVETMSVKNFGQQLTQEGTLTFSWYDPRLLGVSQPPNTKLYEICFDAIGEVGSEASVVVTDKPTIIEIANALSVFLDLRCDAGVVKIIEE